MEFDVCVNGGIVSEHGDDPVAAINAAITEKSKDPEIEVVTVLVSMHEGEEPKLIVSDVDGYGRAAFIEGALWAGEIGGGLLEADELVGVDRESAGSEFDRRRAEA